MDVFTISISLLKLCTTKGQKRKITTDMDVRYKPVAWIEVAHHDEYQITTSGLDLQDKNHHSIYRLGQLGHSASENHMDGINR